MMPVLRERLAGHSAAELAAVFEREGLPFAPITRPQDLFEDPHLLATGGLAPLRMQDGRETRVPLLPLQMDGHRPGVRSQPPAVGADTRDLLASLGYTPEEIDALVQRKAAAAG
jgi:crotonobetainyl-CoA:carnitine CoA-transferase CaiB-like acyl-CoA transferase